MKKSILCLEKTLCDLGYNPDHINQFVGVINWILQTGYAEVKRFGPSSGYSRISAAGVRPLFKINPKSIDVYLITTDELNILRIHHPSNTWAFKDQREKGCFYGNQKWLASSAWDPKRGPNKGFSF